MNKVTQILGISLITIFLTACSSNQEPNRIAEEIDSAVSNVKPDNCPAAGVYVGVTPCADCPGIEKKLTLNKNYTYKLVDHYLESGENSTYIYEGYYYWNDETQIVQLRDDKDSLMSKYKKDGSHLQLLDLKGNEITGDLADKYTLSMK